MYGKWLELLSPRLLKLIVYAQIEDGHAYSFDLRLPVMENVDNDQMYIFVLDFMADTFDFMQ